MKAEEWEKIKTLFDAVLKIEPAKRARWLEEACGERTDVLETVKQLLANYEDSSTTQRTLTEQEPVFSPGELVANRFVIKKLIARGGMGDVYEATDTGLKAIRIALKTVRPGIASEQQAHERFKREVWVAREIDHPAICRIFDLFEHRVQRPDGTELIVPCLTMRLLEGENLGQYLSTRRPLSCDTALPIIRQIAECLDLMHSRQIVHRDVKPSNIMLVPRANGATEVVLIDFGLAKPFSAGDGEWDTKTGQALAGAPFYVAPEVINGDPVGQPADIYAFGLLMDEMVTNAPAYKYDSMEELFWRKLHEQPKPPSARATLLPYSWDCAILWCLERDPARRPTTVRAVVEILERAAPPLSLRVQTMTRRLRFASPMTRRTVIASGIAATAAGGISLNKGSWGNLSTSLLVFPIDNFARDSESYEPLCTGIVEELIRRMSYIDGLRVLGVPLSFNPSPAEQKPFEFSLLGRVAEAEGKIQLNMELKSNHDGATIWRKDYNQNDISDPLRLQSDVMSDVLGALRGEKGLISGLVARILPGSALPGESRRSGGHIPSTRDSRAFSAYNRGRQLWRKRSLSAALLAEKTFKEVVAIDPKYALAYAALADVQHTLLTYNYAPTRHLTANALSYAERAVQLDSTLSECHVARAAAKQNLWEWQDSEESYKKAITAQPAFGRAYGWYGGLLLQFGRFEQSLAQSRLNLSIDPFDLPAISNHALYLWYSGQPREAIRHLERVPAKRITIFGRILLGQIYAFLASVIDAPNDTPFYNKSLQEAGALRTEELTEAAGVDPGFLKWSDLMFVQAFAARRDLSSAHYYIERIQKGFQAGKISAGTLAWAYASLRDRQKTLDMLGASFEQQERELLYVKVYPYFRFLHGDPRFNRILRSMKIV